MPKYHVAKVDFASPVTSGRSLSSRTAKLVYDTDAQILAVEMKDTKRKFIVPSDNIVLLEIAESAEAAESVYKDPPPPPPAPKPAPVDDTFRPAKAPSKGGAK